VISELGITLAHPTVDLDLSAQFTGDEIADAASLTAAILAGTLTWKKTSGGSTELAANYDPDWVRVDLANKGTGDIGDRAVTFKDLELSIAVSASPGFTWGRSGNVTSGAYLLNDTVPSNTAGRIVPVAGGFITKIIVACELADTFTVSVFKRVGASFTLLTSVNMVAQRTGEFTANIAVTLGDELAVQLSTGSAKNVVVGVVIRGAVS
jgi:hypothetical protein